MRRPATGFADPVWTAPDGGLRRAGVLAMVVLGAIIVPALVGLALAARGETSWPPLDWLAGILGFTALQAVLSTALSLALAVPVARAFARRPAFAGRSALLNLMALPAGLPVIAGAFAILAIWGRNGVVNEALLALGLIERPLSPYGLTGILIAHVFFNTPLAARLLIQALDRVPPDQWLLAESLGLKAGARFRLVEWPALKPVIPGLAVTILLLCATSFTLVLTLGGGPANATLEVAIYQAMKLDYDPGRAVVLMAAQLALAIPVAYVLTRLGGQALAPARAGGTRALRPDGWTWSSRLSDLAVMALFTLFVAAPFIEIARAGLVHAPLAALSDPTIRAAALTSLLLATLAAILSVTLALMLGEAARRPGLMRHLAEWPAGLLVLPPVALAAGWFMVLLPFGAIDHAAPFLVAAINALMALPFALRILAPAVAAHHAATDRLAESLGLRGIRRFTGIDLAALRPVLFAAFGFAMALSLGDLGVVALFGSDHLTTLPALLHAKLGSYRGHEADQIAFMLTVLCLFLAWPAARAESRKDTP